MYSIALTFPDVPGACTKQIYNVDMLAKVRHYLVQKGKLCQLTSGSDERKEWNE